MVSTVLELLGGNRLVPVVKLEEPQKAADLATTLRDAGITVIEITFRTSSAAESIRRCRDVADMVVGAGTVRTTRQVDEAIDAGAQFLVSPGFNPEIVRYAATRGIPHIPGTITPGEIEQATALGLSVLKFFPAEQAGGAAFLKALGSVYPEVRFVPTGGIGPGNIADYLALSNVVACGGSWIVKPQWLDAGDFESVRRETEHALALLGG